MERLQWQASHTDLQRPHVLKSRRSRQRSCLPNHPRRPRRGCQQHTGQHRDDFVGARCSSEPAITRRCNKGKQKKLMRPGGGGRRGLKRRRFWRGWVTPRNVCNNAKKRTYARVTWTWNRRKWSWQQKGLSGTGRKLRRSQISSKTCCQDL